MLFFDSEHGLCASCVGRALVCYSVVVCWHNLTTSSRVHRTYPTHSRMIFTSDPTVAGVYPSGAFHRWRRKSTIVTHHGPLPAFPRSWKKNERGFSLHRLPHPVCMYSGGESRGGATHVRIGLRGGLPATACCYRSADSNQWWVTSGGSQGQGGGGSTKKRHRSAKKCLRLSAVVASLCLW